MLFETPILHGGSLRQRAADVQPLKRVRIGGTTICSTVNNVDALCQLSSYASCQYANASPIAEHAPLSPYLVIV